ncbi:unnamed protein product [Macrosiphum euphorbiae]|uniref:Uncharacterized protein n=1 Tax=Macrosiphum euphorbiae TaxID=13131 RepID=A0AAV0WMB4_9HEMI|nr:unnamed protein product [Macrosiphum euphorbiae]
MVYVHFSRPSNNAKLIMKFNLNQCRINRSVTLQSKNATLGKAKSIINGSIQSIEKLRSADIEFSTFWQKITSLAEENDITLEIPLIDSLKKVYLWLAPLITL